jgi:hypothetical protein
MYGVSIIFVVETSTNSGATWQQRQSYTFRFSTSSTTFLTSSSQILQQFSVAGLTADGTDRIRIRLYDVQEIGIGFITEIWVKGSTVTFTTAADQFCSKTPDTDDVVNWEATGYV